MKEEPRTCWAHEIDWSKYQAYSVHKNVQIKLSPFELALPVVKALQPQECVLLPSSTSLVQRLREETGYGLVRKTVCKKPRLMLVMRTE